MAGIKDLLVEQTEGLAKRAQELRKKPVAAARDAAAKSAENLKSLKDPVRAFARSGVKLTTISQGTAKSLIELQERIVASALDDAAAQLERAAASESLKDMLRNQASVLMDARERIVADMAQALTILRGAGGDVREVATRTHGTVAGQTGSKTAGKTGGKTVRKKASGAKSAKRKPARKKSTARKAPATKARPAKRATGTGARKRRR